MKNVKNCILILSGKGGVGKSTCTAELAISLFHAGFKVGVLDIDLTGPSIPEMFGLSNNQVHQSPCGWIPVYTDESQRLGLISLGFLVQNKDDAIIWRGPKKNAMIRQFISDVNWGELDYLLIDTPPGTSDEHISIVENLENPKAILITTPQAVSLSDVMREINFCKKVNVEMLIGLIENMSGFICPHCSECTDIFSSGGGEKLAEKCCIDFLGRIPIDPALTTQIEKSNLIQSFTNSELCAIFKDICSKVISHLPL